MTACDPLDRLMQTLRVYAPGVTDEMLKLQVYNTLDEFFRRTNAWRYEDEIQLSEDANEYQFNVPGDVSIVRLLGVTHNGMPVPSGSQIGALQSSVGHINPELTFVDGDAQFHPDDTDLDEGTGLFSYSVFVPGYITLVTRPNADQTQYPLKAWLALSVGPKCIESNCDDWSVEEWMYQTYFQDWLDGVLGRLFAMPMKPWASPQLAIYHGKRFRNAMAFRKQEATRGFIYAPPPPIRFRSW